MICVTIDPGTYIIAVSGGVDSMVLLDILYRLSNTRLIVAHFDHGIRPDSAPDRKLVQKAAAGYGLPFVYEEGVLGKTASEQAARTARYDFLERMRMRYGASAVITAHHQNDVLETALLNLLRGTGRRGLASLRSTHSYIRPLLQVAKPQILHYAAAHTICWREDPTNADESYLRNYIRHRLLPKFSDSDRDKLLAIIREQTVVNEAIDSLLSEILAKQRNRPSLDRRQFIMLPHAASKELLAMWLREHGIHSYEAPTLERAVIGSKTLPPGSVITLIAGHAIKVEKNGLALVRLER